MLTKVKWFRKFLPVATGTPGNDSQEIFDVTAHSRVQFDGNAAAYTASLLTSFTYFELLPVVTTVVATSEKLCLLIGSNTPVAAQSTTGGLLLTTGATATNQAGVAGIAATGFTAPITASNGIQFRSRVSLAALVTNYVSAGLNQNLTDVNPMATAGEGAAFLFDPANTLTATTGATAAQAANVILTFKVNGAYSYIFTNVPIVANEDYDLYLFLNTDKSVTFYINGIAVGTLATGATAAQVAANAGYLGVTLPLATANATLSPVAGVRTTANATASASIRFLQMSRLIG